jgi:hypothetical protein
MDYANVYGDGSTPITSPMYPIGGSFNQFHAGSTVFTVDSATLPAGTYQLYAILKAASGSVSVALMNLTDASETPLVQITSTNPIGAFLTSGPIPWAAGGVEKTYGIKVCSSGCGFCWAVKIVSGAGV